MKTNQKLSFEFTKTSPYSHLVDLVNTMIKGEEKIIFSIFETSEDSNDDQWMVVHPDILSNDLVIEGNCVFFINYWRVADQPVYSEVVNNPTWKDIINVCNDLLKDGDGCGVFLENIVFRSEKNNVKQFEFHIGS